MATPTFLKINFSQNNKKASLADRVGAHVKNAGPHIVVDLVLQVLLLLVTMVQEVELMMEVITQKEILGNANKVNIQ